MAKLGHRRKGQLGKALMERADATENLAGGLAFEIEDPSQRLLTMIGSSFFNEPTYYNPDPDEDNVDRQPVLKELTKSGKVNVKAVEELDDRSREIVQTAIEVAQSKEPRDLLALANWARTELHIRTTPQVMLSIAAAVKETRKFVRTYCTKIIQRADELRDVFAFHRYFFGGLPASLKRGLGDAFASFKEYDFLKYDADTAPRFRDVLLMIDRAKDWPVTKPVFEYLVNGKVIDEEATPLIAARKKLAAKEKFDSEAIELAQAAQVTWEVLLSQFGKGEDKKKLWEYLVTNKRLGYMAMLRNLRNMLEAKVSSEVVDKIAERLSDKEQVAKSRQLPFRFFSAYRVIGGDSIPVYAHWVGRRGRKAAKVKEADVGPVLDAIDQALKHSADALPQFPGTTAIFADNSGSMGSPVSAKSTITLADAANLLCALSQFCCARSVVGAFGTDVAIVRLSKAARIIDNMMKVHIANTKGMSTNGYKVVQRLRKDNIKVDRVILLSDMQLWNDGSAEYDSYAHWNQEAYQFAPEWKKYLSSVNPKAVLHCVDLAGQGKAVTPAKEKNVNIVSGFSEKILSRLAEFEGIGTKDEKPLPTIEYVRENY